jgi:hypothetical protein
MHNFLSQVKTQNILTFGQNAVKVMMHANARDARREFKKDAHRRTRSVPFALDLRDDSGDDRA